MSIEENFHEYVRHYGAATALVAGDRRLTHAELSLFSQRMAAALAARGIEPGSRVLVFMENSWEAVVSTLAVLKAGAIVTPVNPTATAEALALLTNDCRAVGLITQSSLATVAAAAMAEAPSLRLTVIAGCQGAPAIDGIMRFEDAIALEASTTERSPVAA
jgi:acyl-CoA synthetase (AMP-forming)/AMP-acid ligase II